MRVIVAPPPFGRAHAREGRALYDERVTRFAIRTADSDDAPELAELLAEAFAESDACYPEPEPPSAADLAVRMQTGEAFLLAEDADGVAGVVRRSEDEGIASFDLLASCEAGAGRALVRAIEARAQDGGLRLVRAKLPDETRLADYFAGLGYLPIGRANEAFRGEHVPILTVERRLPLLTVREQRRGDADAIAALVRVQQERHDRALDGNHAPLGAHGTAGVDHEQDQGPGVGLANLLAHVPRFDKQGSRLTFRGLATGLLVGRSGAKGGVQREIGCRAFGNTGADIAAG